MSHKFSDEDRLLLNGGRNFVLTKKNVVFLNLFYQLFFCKKF